MRYRPVALIVLIALIALPYAFISVQNTISQTTGGNAQNFSVNVTNSGNEPLYDARLQVQNAQNSSYFSFPAGIPIRSSIYASGALPVPRKPGTYILLANVTVKNYLNKDFNIISAAPYYVSGKRDCPATVRLGPVSLIGSKTAQAAVSNPTDAALSVTVSVLSSSELELPQPQAVELAPHETKILNLTFGKGLANFNSNHQAYLALETEDSSAHYLSLSPFSVRVEPQPYQEKGKDIFLALGCLFALAAAASVLFRWRTAPKPVEREPKPLSYSIGKFALIALALYLLYRFYMSGMFINFGEGTRFALTVLFGAYLAYAIPYSLKLPAGAFGQKDKIDTMLEFVSGSLREGKVRENFTPEVRTAFLGIAVKAFFLPIMLDFALTNFWAIYGSLNSFSPSYQLFDLIFTWGYGLAMALLFFVDTWVFVLSYGIETPLLGNRIKSVDPTFLGWFVTLICYPPITQLAHAYVPSGPGDWADFNSMLITGAVRTASIALFIIYVWATYALGMRSSNLTNRGIVGRGPYAHVRHPAYASKNLAWLLYAFPSFNPALFVPQALWALVYVMRAYTEERHLSADPEYLAYRKKVKYMFVPGLW
ncbi:Uncharacterised protein [uncultured archaeon]|nr:Uncharacterised protein [uncultured archaeon]